ncbi:MAG TPA: MBL fold metallo-hydrolase [Candidatus Omnitrophota bacterium]|nr:MBL fold metallo-hydrolase [Candidatus Omnitrophota bacterium]HRY85023.1 MBL fold metallo-hydrolase [Candidatus Omnitrophota bacterium]
MDCRPLAVDQLYFKQIPVGYMGNFVYLIGDKKKKECAVVDPAWDVDAVLKKATQDGMTVTAGILTHTHFDHVNGVEDLIRKTGAKIYVHELEAKYLKSIQKHLVETREGSKLKIGDIEMTFLHTPGHTEGAQCILVGDRLVTGDTLFVGACGRCDLPGGSEQKIMQSLKRLASLDGSLKVFPGHAYGDADSSTIEHEKKTNPFMRF